MDQAKPDRPAIFLDRDGVLNEDDGYTHRAQDLRLLPGVPKALKQLHEAGFVLIVVSNQSGVARGLYNVNDVQSFHKAMTRSIMAAGGYAPDGYYFCPHLPDAERPEFRLDCDCRKPEPGMLLQAAKEHRLDLRRSIMVGDRPNDITCAHRAGCAGVQIISENHALHEAPDGTALSLSAAIPLILKIASRLASLPSS